MVLNVVIRKEFDSDNDNNYAADGDVGNDHYHLPPVFGRLVFFSIE